MAQSRRMMLKVSIALPLAAPAAATAAVAPAGDAELVRLCAEFDVWERRDRALSGDCPVGSQAEADEDALNTRSRAEQHKLLDRICDLPCTTTAGVYALGHTLALYVGEEELEDGFKGGTDDRLLATLLRGITGKAPVTAAAPAAANPDAELIRVCAEHTVNRDTLNHAVGTTPLEDEALWDAYARTRDAIAAAEPQTLEGMLAKARAAKAEAQGLGGVECPENTPAADWAWDLVNDLLRMSGQAVA